MLTRTEQLDDPTARPYSGWDYQPDYFPQSNAFHIGDNATDLIEPLCIYVPFMEPIERQEVDGAFSVLSRSTIHVPSELSDTLKAVHQADRIEIVTGDEHLVILTFDRGELGLSTDLRPLLPIVIRR